MNNRPSGSRLTKALSPLTRRTALSIITAIGWSGLPATEPVGAKKRCKQGKTRCQGRCIPKDQCCTDANCGAQRCCEGVCAECCTDDDCAFACIDGVCRSQPCATNAACPEPQLCWAFQCVAAGGSCPPDGDCPFNQVCRDGLCLGGGLCFLDGNCRASQVCVDGVCQGGNACTASAQCDFGQTCQEGICQGGGGTRGRRLPSKGSRP